MKKLLILGGVFCFVILSRTAPTKIFDAEEEIETEEIDEDDSTTHTFDRLSSAATCLVAGVEYTHGQQIYRDDPCEFCLCLDGEMFCWWQDCPPTLEGPCRDRLPFSPCANGPKSSASPKEYKTSSTQKMSSIKHTESVSTEMIEPISSIETTEAENSSETSTINNSSPVPTSCIVMGREYQIGASLPHDTGNCIECICGPGAEVTCSPHQCAPPGDDINDYRPPGLRPDTF